MLCLEDILLGHRLYVRVAVTRWMNTRRWDGQVTYLPCDVLGWPPRAFRAERHANAAWTELLLVVRASCHDMDAVEVVQHRASVLCNQQLARLHIHVDAAGDIV